ncbi:MAG: PKD domain-containing protein [Vicingaceae bacterium]
MKKLIAIFILVLLTSITVYSQEWCATDQMLEQYLQENPEERARIEDEMYFDSKDLKPINKSSHYVIPVVIHVIHYEGEGNISKKQILNGLEILNDDFSKQNSDTSIVRNVFKPLIADMEIEFRLAELDPNGNCTEGINRINSHLSIDKRNEPKGLIQWDPDSYLNVWIVNSIEGGGGIGGFAQFPFSGSASTYGLVVRADEWGNIELGTQGSFAGRAVSHEVGHCLNLFHPFQSGCGSNCASSGDGVCDTPPQASSNNNSCNHSFNTCSNDANGGSSSNINPYNSDVPDQLENIMGYGVGCQVMFTEGQKVRVYNTIASSQRLSSLVSSSNLTQTGTSDNHVSQTCTPRAEIIDDSQKLLCLGSSVTFEENSYGGSITSYSWTFAGGTPSTSSDPTPTVTYSSAGTYDVTLTVSNSSGSNSITLEDYIVVADTSSAMYSTVNYEEDFENKSKFENEWMVNSSHEEPEWEHANFASYEGNGSVWVNNFAAKLNGSDFQLISPTFNFTRVIKPEISFEVSYSRVESSDNDKLKLHFSDDCGQNWFNVYSVNPSFFAFDNTLRNSNFLPSSKNEWVTITIPGQFIPSRFKNSDRVRVMIEVENGGGNNFFIDNFRIKGEPVGLAKKNRINNSFTVFPNPTKGDVTINIVEKFDQAEVFIHDIMGKRVKEVYKGSLGKEYIQHVDLGNLSPGVYFITLQTTKGKESKKIIVQ